MASQVLVDCLFHKQTNTCTFIVRPSDSKECAIIDSVLDFTPADGTCSFTHNEAVIHFVESHQLVPKWILETHAHADHITGAHYLKLKYPGAKVAIGEHITKVQAHFKKVFNLEDEFVPDGSQFDHLFRDGEEFGLGGVTCKVIHTPGHTPDSVSYLIGDAVFSGDTLFMPDGGSARCDFPSGSAKELYQSIHGRLYTLPDSTRMFVGHDYGPNGRAFQWETTIKDQKGSSLHIKHATTEEEYVSLRETRDKTLSAPNLLLYALQVNIRAGKLPPAEGNGQVYLKIPIRMK
jgi:glyoxylase-like metal-dependent hydrolase (beta-lactamase superfamily II)